VITKKYAELKNLDPFFDAITMGLKGLVDGEHLFDFIDDNITYEFRYRYPGLPEKLIGKDDMLKVYAGVCDVEVLHSSSGLVVHRTTDPRVVILEFDVQGKSLRSGKPYENRTAIVLTIDNRKIVYWRDYLDSLAAWTTHGE
jgi:ketosteroid isomerase-like protein